MIRLALKRLFSRPWLTLFSILGVAITVGLVGSIPIFARAVSFAMLQEELELNARAWRPPFAVRIYAFPSGRYALSLAEWQSLGNRFSEAVSEQVGLPLLGMTRYAESAWVALRTRADDTAYGSSPASLAADLNLAVVPGSESRMRVLDGEPMDGHASAGEELSVWMHRSLADEMGIRAGERFEVQELLRGAVLPVRVAGIWQADDPRDTFWFGSPDLDLRGKLLVREQDYRALAEPALQAQLEFVYWYLVLDYTRLVPENMRAYAEGLENGVALVSQYLPDAATDGAPLRALEEAMARESRLGVLLFVLNVPVTGFLLYFVGLISAIAVRWQGRETAMMVSRGLDRWQLTLLNLGEALGIVAAGGLVGLLLSPLVARSMAYARSFMSFTWREPLPISTLVYSPPMLAATVSASLLARLWPSLGLARGSVVTHERARSRAADKPFWQRFYLDILLLLLAYYAFTQLKVKGTLVPQVLSQGNDAMRDPLLFLSPFLFALACSLLLVRLFPLLMHLGDWLSTLGRWPTPYLAFRQLSRQSGQYTSALLLVIAALSLGGFMASLALSLDRWLSDRVRYAIGADVLIEQTPNPLQRGETSPTEGAWILPASSYAQVPGVLDAARVGMYPATVERTGRRPLQAVFIGIDRLDAPRVLFYRPDFSDVSLGELMNRLAGREDGILVSDKVLKEEQYEVGDKLRMHVGVAGMPLQADLTIVGTFRHFPTVYELADRRTALVGNLDHLFDLLGATLLHNVWLKIDPQADRRSMVGGVERMGVYIGSWQEARERIAEEQARGERVGVFGTLSLGFLAAAILSGVGLLVYTYASLQERLFRFTILRAVGLSLWQVVGQVITEYSVLTIYSVLTGAVVGIWASVLFVPFFQATDQQILNPPTLIPLIAWGDILRVSAIFAAALVVVQATVIGAAIHQGVFRALRLGDQE